MLFLCFSIIQAFQKLVVGTERAFPQGAGFEAEQIFGDGFWFHNTCCLNVEQMGEHYNNEETAFFVAEGAGIILC